jgi:SPP1 gp7 family putative phage head morphogenesis protein
MAWTEAQAAKLIEGVYGGVISAFNLPEALFDHTFGELMDAVNSGYKVAGISVDAAKIEEGFRKNINEFSGAKTANEVITLSEAAIGPTGAKLSFKEYKKIGRAIDSEYNLRWLKTEQNTAFAQAQSADQWVRTQDKKHLFPMLQYQTVGDGRVRPEHRDWNGIIKPVDDEFWDTHMPPADWGCRCRVIRLRQGVETDLDEQRIKVNKKREKIGEPLVSNMKNSSDVFDTNPAKTKYIFKKATASHFVDTRAAGLVPGNDNYGLGYK